MPRSTSHGFPYQEPERHDELSDGTPAPVHEDAREERTPDGRLTKGAKRFPSMGGKARKGSTKLSHRIDNGGLGVYAKRARFFRKAATTELAALVGNGRCGILPSALVKLAAQALALAEAALEAGDVEGHRKLGESARMHLVYAREMVAKDAAARATQGVGASMPWLLPATTKDDKR